jgi:hypothetical protein
LQHYANRLIRLKGDSNIRDITNALIADLQDSASLVQHVFTSFDNPDIHWKAIDDNKEIVCCALTCYLNDLNKSIQYATQELGGAKLDLKSVNRQIDLIKMIQNDEGCEPPEEMTR